MHITNLQIDNNFAVVALGRKAHPQPPHSCEALGAPHGIRHTPP